MAFEGNFVVSIGLLMRRSCTLGYTTFPESKAVKDAPHRSEGELQLSSVRLLEDSRGFHLNVISASRQLLKYNNV